MKLLIAIKTAVMADLLALSLPVYEVLTCDTGADALVALEAHRPDALIVDLTLPDMDGLTVLQKSRHKPKVILALTNVVTKDIQRSALEAGVQEVIRIPCTVRQITERLETLTENTPSAKV